MQIPAYPQRDGPRGKTLAKLDCCLYCGDLLVAEANGTYAIFRPSQSKG